MTKRTKQPIPNSTQDVQKDVDRLANAEPVTVELGQYVFTVRPLKMRQVFPFLKLVRPIFAALSKTPGTPATGLPPAAGNPGQGGTPNDPQAAAQAALPANVQYVMNDADWMLSMAEDHGPTILKALACGLDTTNNPDAQRQLVEQMEDLDVVDVIVLAKHFIVVNASFFTARGLTLPMRNAPPVSVAM